jgi:hypothetical protein
MGVIIGAVLSAALKIIMALLKLIADAIKKILFATRLIIPFTYAVIMAILFLLGVIEYNGLNLFLAVAGGCALTVFAYYVMVKRRIKKLAPAQKQQPQIYIPKNEKPAIYRIMQNPRYVMYEYSDRVELYKETEKGLMYIRTDFKKNG